MASDQSCSVEAHWAIPYLDFGGAGRLLHFLHANGYPPACYGTLLERFRAKYHVFGMLLRPLWPAADPQAIRDWDPFSEDLRKFLKERGVSNVIGMGHSIGAIVTLRAALREPTLFRALVLIDPVLLPRKRMLELRLARTFGMGHRMKGKMSDALRRRRRFDDLEQLFKGYRRRDVFRFFSDGLLHALIRGMTRPTTDGSYELVYSPEWEARIYETGIWNDWDIWTGLKRLKMPTMIIRGAETDTFWESTARMVRKANSDIRILSVQAATHLVPLERPDDVFDMAQQFLQRIENVKPI